MQFFSSLDDVPTDFGPSAVTIGKFDGVHAGHRRVLAQLTAAAATEGLVSTVVTFDRHPLAVLNPAACPENLQSLDQKRAALEETGVDVTVAIEFTLEFSRLTPEEFVRLVLVDSLHAKLVIVGTDFRFGADGKGTVGQLEQFGRQFGFEVRMIESVRTDGERAVSSTWIRSLLAGGSIAEATDLLGRLPSVRAVVVRGEQRGKELGFPTANLSADLEGFIPADGVYAAYLTVDGVTMPAAVSIGNNPTFDGVAERQVEAFVLDRDDLELYGKTVEVAFVELVRGMRKFDGIDELVAQIRNDVSIIREILGVPAP